AGDDPADPRLPRPRRDRSSGRQVGWKPFVEWLPAHRVAAVPRPSCAWILEVTTTTNADDLLIVGLGHPGPEYAGSRHTRRRRRRRLRQLSGRRREAPPPGFGSRHPPRAREVLPRGGRNGGHGRGRRGLRPRRGPPLGGAERHEHLQPPWISRL